MQKKSQNYFVYILRCIDNTLYTGVTNNVERRFAQHLAGQASRYTRAHPAKQIIYVERCKNKGAALKREYAIKRLSRTAKLSLVDSNHRLS